MLRLIFFGDSYSEIYKNNNTELISIIEQLNEFELSADGDIAKDIKLSPDIILTPGSNIYDVEESPTNYYRKMDDGTVVPVYTEEELFDYRNRNAPRTFVPEIIQNAFITKIKIECKRKIDSVYPLWKQMNIIREGGQKLLDMNSYIDDLRNKSNQMEEEIKKETDTLNVLKYKIEF